MSVADWNHEVAECLAEFGIETLPVAENYRGHPKDGWVHPDYTERPTE